MSIRTKILLPMVAMAMVCALITGTIAIIVVIIFTNDFNNTQVLTANDLAASLLQQRRDDAARLSAMSAENEQLVAGIESHAAGGERDAMVNAAVSLMTATGVDFLTVLDTEGNVLVRAHEPDNFGDSLANQTNVQKAMSGSQYTTIEKGSAVKLSVRSGTPIYGSDGGMVALVSLGYRLDQNGFVDYLKQSVNTEVSVFLGDVCVSTTLESGGSRAVDRTADGSVAQQVLGGDTYMGRQDEAGIDLYTIYAPIRDTEGSIIGMMGIGLDTSETDERIMRDIVITLVFMVFLTLTSALVSRLVSGRIVNPISAMAVTARSLAEGDVNTEIPIQIHPGSKDETEQLAMAFADMIRSNQERAKIIEALASGDLSGDIVLASGKDVVGIALTELLRKNNMSFGEMIAAAAQLDSASKQIADGAQDLSNGSARQAETVEDLNGRLKDLSDRSVAEANQAREAAQLSSSVKDHAEKGNRQMEQMIEAIEQISKASEAIEKVIKVIDDIAFQTNILALNAAVEAARAGQHGKGFAVVAEEVRNLASKSAEAAKDTGELIANSIEKAKLGASISAETAASFADIVEGINKSTVIVDRISDFMQQQKAEIEGIANGVENIRTIVMAVNASAEESAAASQEMKERAAMMANTLSGYNLRKQDMLLEEHNVRF